MPDELFQPLLREAEKMTWEPETEVRVRANRRTQRARLMVVAGATVAVMAAGVAVAFAQRQPDAEPDPAESSPVATAPATPSAEPSAEPSAGGSSSASPQPSTAAPAQITDDWFLRPGDIGPDYRSVRSRESSGDWTFEFVAGMFNCPAGATGWRAQASEYRSFTPDPGQDVGLAQYVARFAPGTAARYLTEVRSRVAGCRPQAGRSIRILAERFAGQDSVIVESRSGGSPSLLVIVRQGDRLTEFWAKPSLAAARAQELGRVAAARLSN